MSAQAANDISRSETASAHLSRPAPGIIAALFSGYLAVGLPLPVIPLFVHDKLGFSNLIVGLVIGIQFLATVLTRGYAGRLTDHHGGKRSALQGAAVCTLGGLLYLVAAMLAFSPAISLAIIIVGRLVAGFGESQFVTGCVSWSIASVGPQRAGMSMSWTGIAMFAALAIGAPIGMGLYQAYGLQAAMVACVLAPFIAVGIAFREVSYTNPPGQRLPFYRVVGQIWREGLGLMLQGVGLSGLTAFASLYFAARGWGRRQERLRLEDAWADAVGRHLGDTQRRAAIATRLCTRLAGMAAELARQDNPSPEQLFSTLEEMTMLDGTIHSTTGMLVYDDTAAAHDYIVRVFGLTPGQPPADAAERDVYREVRAGDQVIGLHPSAEGFRSPGVLGAVTGMTVISVDDADAHYARSVAAGAEIVEEPIDQPYGIREYGARDPEGQLWYFHSPLG